jgi:hypothetical protein
MVSTVPHPQQALIDELHELRQHQSDARDIATYLTMDKATSQLFDTRATRIGEILKLLKPV